ncbi:MAG: efflux RND transporter periplasmic adaptor subunit [Elusimicrobia bacterium]|nr:efflux RND transporter periplasmic adaptor subunit [Elusimicrobiota bacterium]MBD3412017.1 efflux RND transporter periplasmic adaptor subunit [Elusimicrobiota bacterium]
MKKKTTHKKTIIIILVLLVAILTLWIINKRISKKTTVKPAAPAQQSGEQRMPVNVYKVSRQNFKDTLLALGTVKGGVQIELRFEKEGRVKQFRFKEGDRVTKGEVVAQLDQQDALLKLKQARIDLDQHKKLYEAGAIIKLKLDQVANAYDQANLELEKTKLRAPRTGIISNKEVEIGEFITPNTKIATLIDMEKVIVEVGIIEKDINKLMLGQEVAITFDAYPGFDFIGKVYNIPPDLGTKVPMLQVKIQMENPDALILPGMFARCLISIYEEENALIIPITAIDKSADEPRVFVVGERNRVSERTVTVTYTSSEYALLSSGLNAGELIVSDKPESLKTGTEVEIIELTEYQP